jgi:hypothetical protein
MYRGKGHISDKLAIVIIWGVALAFLFLVVQKFKILFH